MYPCIVFIVVILVITVYKYDLSQSISIENRMVPPSTALQDAHILNLKTYEYITLHDKKGF